MTSAILGAGLAAASLCGVDVRFVELVSDSRCPPKAVCVWAGEVSAKFEFASGGKKETRKLSTQDVGERAAVVLGRRFEIENVVGGRADPRAKVEAEMYRFTVGCK